MVLHILLSFCMYVVCVVLVTLNDLIRRSIFSQTLNFLHDVLHVLDVHRLCTVNQMFLLTASAVCTVIGIAQTQIALWIVR